MGNFEEALVHLYQVLLVFEQGQQVPFASNTMSTYDGPVFMRQADRQAWRYPMSELHNQSQQGLAVLATDLQLIPLFLGHVFVARGFPTNTRKSAADISSITHGIMGGVPRAGHRALCEKGVFYANRTPVAHDHGANSV